MEQEDNRRHRLGGDQDKDGLPIEHQNLPQGEDPPNKDETPQQEDEEEEARKEGGYEENGSGDKYSPFDCDPSSPDILKGSQVYWSKLKVPRSSITKVMSRWGNANHGQTCGTVQSSRTERAG